MERPAHAVRSFDDDVRVVMERVIGRDHHASAALQGLLDVLDAGDVELDDLLVLAERVVDERSPPTHQPRLEAVRPRAGRSLEGLAVHGCGGRGLGAMECARFTPQPPK